MFYIEVKELEGRTKLQQYLREEELQTAFPDIPVHSAPAGQQFGRFHGEDCYTTKESERLVRLPMYYGLSREDVNLVISRIIAYFHK